MKKIKEAMAEGDFITVFTDWWAEYSDSVLGHTDQLEATLIDRGFSKEYIIAYAAFIAGCIANEVKNTRIINQSKYFKELDNTSTKH